MTDTWKKFDLAGGGVQSVNLAMARYQKKTGTAYFYWLGFLFGAHRFYLKSPAKGLIYVTLTSIAMALLVVFQLPPFELVAVLIFAIYDLFWIPRQVLALNKSLRMALYLQKDAAPPTDYKGRYIGDEHEKLLHDYTEHKDEIKDGILAKPGKNVGGAGNRRVLSFAEQEALLKKVIRPKNTDK